MGGEVREGRWGEQCGQEGGGMGGEGGGRRQEKGGKEGGNRLSVPLQSIRWFCGSAHVNDIHEKRAIKVSHVVCGGDRGCVLEVLLGVKDIVHGVKRLHRVGQY